MIVLSRFQHLSSLQLLVIDTSLLTLFSGLGIWFFIIVPERKKNQIDIASSIHILGQENAAFDQIAIVSTTDLQGNIIYINDNFCKISGYSREELIQKDHRILNSKFHTKEFYKDLWLNLKAGKPWRGQIRNLSKDGKYYWVDSYFAPIFDDQNKPCRYVAFQFDVTSEKLAEVALEEEKIKSAHMGRLSAIGEMASGIAHEINNPLTVIKGSLTLIDRKLRSLNATEEHTKLLDTVFKAQHQVNRVVRIINGLREFSRSGTDQSFELVSSKKIIDSVEDLCSEKIKSLDILFEKQPGDIDLECNSIQIEQVLVNLICNSIDALSHLKERWIKVEAQKVGEFVEISVTDSGEGIQKELTHKIMQPFFTTKEIGKGTGLGLSISRAIVEKHGGVLFLDTTSNNTRFVIQIPLQDSALFELIDVEEAIASHLSWRQKIISQSSCSHSNIDSKKLALDNECAVGQWIARIEPRFKNNAEFIELKNSHTKFHEHAGEIARRHELGEAGTAELLLGSGSDYDRLSKRVICALEEFRRKSKPASIRKAA